MTKITKIDVESLMDLAITALKNSGVSQDHAASTAKILVEADMMGISTHGVVRLPGYLHRIQMGGVDGNAQPTVDRRASSLALVDGANALGPVVGTQAIRTAQEMTAESGMAYVGCKNSNHFGALAPYALEVCEAGFAMIAGTSASTSMPPWGGAELRIGNNPFCMATPASDGNHFILDMAMSVAARGKIRAAKREGTSIPEGWAVDAQGRPTTDPSEALAGFLIPFGAHKGSGLSMAVDLFSGVLTGAQFLTNISSWSDHPENPQQLGHFFILLDPGRLLGKENYEKAMAQFQKMIQETPPSDPSTPVCLPGQMQQESRKTALKEGLSLPSDLWQELQGLAASSVVH